MVREIMPKILICTQHQSDKENVINPLKEVGYIVEVVDNKENLIEKGETFLPDIVVLSLNEDVEDISYICRKIRLLDQSSDIQIILVIDKNLSSTEISPGADAYVERPLNPAVLLSTVNAHLRLKNHLDIFSSNNSELAKRFYQLKVLYDTNSKLAGTLNRKKLIKID